MKPNITQDSLSGQKMFGANYKTLSIMLSGAAIFLLFLVPQITGSNVAEISSFYTQDSHCIESTVITKLHCFGDFGYGIEMVRSGKSIWSKEFLNPYPPINFQLFLLFSYIAAKVNYLFSLLLYLATLVASVMIPFLHALKKKPLKHTWIYISTSVVATFPFLVVIDRGNNIRIGMRCQNVFHIFRWNVLCHSHQQTVERHVAARIQQGGVAMIDNQKLVGLHCNITAFIRQIIKHDAHVLAVIEQFDCHIRLPLINVLQS